jgi:hypothetical protein
MIRVALRFNPAPGWPTPPEGWSPPPDWAPDPAWPPAPARWPLWVTNLVFTVLEGKDATVSIDDGGVTVLYRQSTFSNALKRSIAERRYRSARSLTSKSSGQSSSKMAC